MKFRTTVIGLGVLSLCAVLSYAVWGRSGSSAVETGSMRAPISPTSAAAPKDAILLASLVEREVPVDSIISVDVTREELDARVAGERRVRVGVSKPIDARVELSSLHPSDLTASPRAVSNGSVRGDGNGGFTWTGVVESSGAAALRLRFTNFFLPNNGTLYLYNDLGEVFGPYTGRGPNNNGAFWSHTLRGSTVTLQLSYDGEDTARALHAARFIIADLGYLDDRFVLALNGPAGDAQSGEGLCGGNAPCVENASCSTLDDAIDPARDAVAMIVFASGNGPFSGIYACSGGLINDTDEGSVKPYFLTANHCVSKGNEAGSVETFFHYTVQCDTPCGGIPSVSSTLGASIVKTGRNGDYTLLELAEQPPGGTVLLGWDSSPVAFSNGVPLSRISHPQASPQAHSEHDVDTSRPTCTSWPRGSWIYSTDTYGGTEGGSSGSPVLNSLGQIVGQLSGACGYNVNDSCDSAQNATVDGAFAAYFADIAQFLDPNDSCTDADNDGFCAGSEDCNDADAAIYPGATEVCDDSVDNDCDGLVDDADPACQTGTCDLFPAGESCESDNQCCSAKCKGKPNNTTCR